MRDRELLDDLRMFFDRYESNVLHTLSDHRIRMLRDRALPLRSGG